MLTDRQTDRQTDKRTRLKAIPPLLHGWLNINSCYFHLFLQESLANANVKRATVHV